MRAFVLFPCGIVGNRGGDGFCVEIYNLDGVIDGKYGEFLPRKARKRVSPDTEAITKRDLRANQSYLRHFPSGRKVIGETRREISSITSPTKKLSAFSVVNILTHKELILRRCVFTHVVEYMCIRDFLGNADVSA